MVEVDTGRAESGVDTTTDPTLARYLLGLAIRQLHAADGRSGVQIAPKIGVSVPTVNRWLRGANQDMKPSQVLLLLSAFGYGPEDAVTRDLMKLAVDAKRHNVVQGPAWLRASNLELFVALESVARRILTYEPTLVPGILQTSGYVQAVLRPRHDDAAVAEWVQHRQIRQRILNREEQPAELHVVIDEAVLRRRPADPTVMREQLEHLLTVGTQSNVTIRVIPFDAGLYLTGSNGSFVVLESGNFGRVAYIETPDAATYLETAEATGRYLNVWERLLSWTLDEEKSAALIAEILRTT